MADAVPVNHGDRMFEIEPVGLSEDAIQKRKDPKYRPDFPDRFDAYEDAETFGQRFFPWYNLEHRHGALGLMTPHDIHYGLAEAKWKQRAEVLRTAYAAHPERFPLRVPVPPPLPTAVWINKPPAPPA